MIHLPETLPGTDRSLLLLCDHASNHVPNDLDLGLADAVLTTHIAWDIGTDPLTRALAARLDAPAILGTVSRLVIDLHRDPGHPGLVPVTSDGVAVPGNRLADVAARLARFHLPHHDAVARAIADRRPDLIVALHSFTPRLASNPAPRPWTIGLLHNRDARAARLAIDWLQARGHVVGDNQPYSGRLLNATQDRHAEANFIPYLMIELRNDGIADAAGVAFWTDELASLIDHVRNRVAPECPSAT